MKVRKSIKKPRFIISYLGSFVIVAIILACMGLIAFYGASNSYNSLAEIRIPETEADVHTAIVDFLLNKRKITAQDRTDIKFILLEHFSQTSQRFKVYFDNEEIADSTQTALMYYYTDEEHYNLEIADKKYLEYFKTPELSDYWKTGSESLADLNKNDRDNRLLPKAYESKVLNLEVREAYIDLEHCRFIPIVCVIDDSGKNDEFGFATGPIVSIPNESENRVPEGYTLYKPGKYYPAFSATIEGFDGPDNDYDYGDIDYRSNGGYKFFGYKKTLLKWIPFATVYSSQIRSAVCLMIVAAIILSLIPASIIYNIQKRKFDIFEYRRKMTDAMAHDLKSPMAAISAFAENLSDNIATDKREYYAGKIEEKVSQMNKMVNDILEFSKSENSPAVINKVNVDIGDVIKKAIADNEHTIDDRSLKINCDKKNITIQTDLKLFSQAISNLINNAVLYSKEGTAIDITFDEKSMVISNISEENVDNAEELKQPFVKGSTERGTKGSGLGLAIAENNFAMLGYKLEVSSDEGRFVTTIKL